ncbi:MAG: hypothetical protein MRY83_16690, partial [Flavobacteriales bacterium]|nr:hypothetical protein [Flavobacteriales bacterium]
MKKHSLTGTVVLIFLASTLFSQALLTNDGGIIFVEEQVFMEIQGDVYFEEGSTTPEMDLFGDLYVSGNWYNNSSGPGISVISEGTVSLDGANQFIGGTNSSHFPSLWTEGGPVIKQLFNNVFVHKNFNLFDAYFETNQHILEITNSNPNALSWQNGFVGSSIMGGYIGRAISAGGSYMFP